MTNSFQRSTKKEDFVRNTNTCYNFVTFSKQNLKQNRRSKLNVLIIKNKTIIDSLENQLKIKEIIISKLNSKIARIKFKLKEYKNTNRKLLSKIKNQYIFQKNETNNVCSVK